MKNTNEYFRMFIGLAQHCCDAAQSLHNTLKNFDPKRVPEMLQHMHAIEHSADVDKHALMKKLAREFIPPIEREDIVSLSQEIDNVTDAIEEVIIRLYMYNIQEIRSDAIAMSAVIVKSCDELLRGMKEFENFRKSDILLTVIVEINRLEEVGDKLQTEAIRKLYTGSRDPVKVMAWTSIFEGLEACCDAAEHAANIIESIMMKNS
ncbi:MAG: DUF47 domain-containing protein [Clostridiales bacterium]|jgi:predicted phosphate transport protein (TIGR00153 family)|nr:DUF47 domain-containing protein [Clostridiales bacterium]